MDRKTDLENEERDFIEDLDDPVLPSEEELEHLIEEKYWEMEILETESRRREAAGTAEQLRRHVAEQTRNTQEVRRRASRETGTTQRTRRPAEEPGTIRRSRRPDENPETARVVKRRRPAKAKGTRKAEGTRTAERADDARARRRMPDAYDERRIEEREYPQEDMGKKKKKEKARFSERLIKNVGGLIGIIIALLVVLVVFGGNLLSGIIGGGDADLASSKGVVNILLVGQDAREGVDGSRSDSMMLVSVNKDTDKVKIISLMRDMYVSIPGHDDNRINAAYSYGGVDLLAETVEENFKVKIDGNVQIDFESFKTVIDEVGGVDIELSQAEADYLNQAYWQNGWTLTAGVQNLNGEQALAYSRVRQVGNSDFERTERQRTVLMTAFKKVKAQGKLKMLSLAKDIYPMLDTDIALNDMISLGLAALNLSDDSIETYRLPMDGGYENQTIREMQVLVPNLEMNQNYLKELIFGTTETE